TSFAEHRNSPFGMPWLPCCRRKCDRKASWREAGDVALQKIAEALRSVAGQSDIEAHYGGDALTFILHDMQIRPPYWGASRARRADMTIVHEDSPTGYRPSAAIASCRQRHCGESAALYCTKPDLPAETDNRYIVRYQLPQCAAREAAKGRNKKPAKPCSNAGFGITGGDEKIRTSDTLLGYAPLAGECLRPLGHVSEPDAIILASRVRVKRKCLLIEAEGLVQHAHSQLEILFIDHDRDLDFRSRDHLDIDALFRQRAEHLAGDARMRAHANADGGHLADLLVADHGARTDMLLHRLFEDLLGAKIFAAIHGEGEVGRPVMADVLDDHVDIDIGVGDRAENLVGDTGLVGHAQHSQLGLVTIEGNAGNDWLFHRGIFL